MAIRNIYICSECGEQTSKWAGKCLSCNAWNSLVEDAVDTEAFKKIEAKAVETMKLSEERTTKPKIKTGIEEFDRVIGDGLMADGLTLFTGDPGIGKSTLSLQVALKVAEQGKKVLYVTGEESVDQVRNRAQRLNGELSDNFLIMSETDLDRTLATVEKERPDFVVADSVQVLSSIGVSGHAGSVVQTRNVAEQFMHVAKKKGIAVLLIGHVTKEGSLAGPRVLEHLVDTVLFLEGDRYHELRILRAQKNRFGATTEVGVFEMVEEGLREVGDPSAFFIQGRKEGAVGSVMMVTMEGTRPFMIEVQALTNKADFNYPKRASSGVPLNRLQLLTAVLAKHAGLSLENEDVYTNLAGGFSVSEPAVDLAMCAAIISSRREIAVPSGVVVMGEVGLSGEVRPVSQEERRIKEAAKLGFTEVWGNVKARVDGVDVRRLESVSELRMLIEKDARKSRTPSRKGVGSVDPILREEYNART